MEIAEKVDAKYIVALSEYGYAAKMTSRHRGHTPILVVTPSQTLVNQSAAFFGCYPILTKPFKSFDEALKSVKPELIKQKLVKKGDKVVIVSGVPFAKSAESNVVLVETI
jgi:pyruvate kinase